MQDLVVAYQTSMRPSIERALERGSRYVTGMKATLVEEGVPAEFAYGVPIVESGYSVSATSSAGAVGPWQFIRGTGQRYGLRIDGYVDERRDPEKATRAAARYLRDLYDRFGDWHLALAAYNTGEGNIERIKDNRGCEDFWEMRERGYLPSETSEYVPRVLAAMQVAQSAKRYGIYVPPSAPDQFETVQIMRPISLNAVAQLCGSNVDTIKDLNPALKRGQVPPDGYAVRLPQGTREQFEVALATYREPAPTRPEVRAGGVHTVRRGDTLARVAQRYGVSLSALMRANGMRRAKPIKNGQRLQIPAGGRRQRVMAANDEPDAPAPRGTAAAPRVATAPAGRKGTPAVASTRRGRGMESAKRARLAASAPRPRQRVVASEPVRPRSSVASVPPRKRSRFD
ncbi:MAG: transglycosylase SLT domain-containing protein [bacterium]